MRDALRNNKSRREQSCHTLDPTRGVSRAVMLVYMVPLLASSFCEDSRMYLVSYQLFAIKILNIYADQEI